MADMTTVTMEASQQWLTDRSGTRPPVESWLVGWATTQDDVDWVLTEFAGKHLHLKVRGDQPIRLTGKQPPEHLLLEAYGTVSLHLDDTNASVWAHDAATVVASGAFSNITALDGCVVRASGDGGVQLWGMATAEIDGTVHCECTVANAVKATGKTRVLVKALGDASGGRTENVRTVSASGEALVSMTQPGRVEATDDVLVRASAGHIEATGRSRVEARGRAVVHATDHVVVRAKFHAEVSLQGHARADIRNYVRASASDNATIVLQENARTTLYDSARAAVHGSAQCDVYSSDVHIEAVENTQITLHRACRPSIVATPTVRITRERPPAEP